MKRVGIDTSPLQSGHSVRGVGFYVKRLLPELIKQAGNYDIEISPRLNDCDLIHYPYFDLFSHTLPDIKRAKTVVTVHDVIPLEFSKYYPAGVKGSLNLNLQKRALATVEKVITDSEASKEGISKYLQVPKSKVEVIYLAADDKFHHISNTKKLSLVGKKYHLPKKFVLYVGDVNWNKNLIGLVKACDLARYPLIVVGKQAVEISLLTASMPWGPKDVLRRLVGRTHPQLMHLNELEKLFKKDHVKRLGFVSDEDLVAIYNLASVYCQPSFAEGFGLPVLEALACGTAVACSRTHSLPEIAGKAAVYFDPYNIEDMAEAIKSAHDGKGEKQAKKFSWAQTATQTLAVYEQLLK